MLRLGPHNAVPSHLQFMYEQTAVGNIGQGLTLNFLAKFRRFIGWNIAHGYLSDAVDVGKFAVELGQELADSTRHDRSIKLVLDKYGLQTSCV